VLTTPYRQAYNLVVGVQMLRAVRQPIQPDERAIGGWTAVPGGGALL